jgi:predicted ATP-dependent endonuclease of OLD family
MRLTAFQIKGFRSIVDTGYIELPPDNITCLIGQNESGKTSVLEALRSFETGKISGDDIRSAGPKPEVSCYFQVDKTELEIIFEEFNINSTVWTALKDASYQIHLQRTWEEASKQADLVIVDDALSKALSEITPEPEQKPEVGTPDSATTPESEIAVETKKQLTTKDFLDVFFNSCPELVLFENYTSLLPRTIDLEELEKDESTVEGFLGAKNLISIAELDLAKLKAETDTRIIDDKLDSLNKKITEDFQKYWSQNVGKNDKIQIKMELKHHDESVEAEKGKPYMIFWISDSQGRLHANQRSMGVRWFLSFYLQLEATAKSEHRLFLVDEPGGSLHAKAQEDVLKLFEKLKKDLQIVFTTHSPYLVDIKEVHRILAVQRELKNGELAETKIINSHKLGGANEDTLFPLYTSMGIDISHQRVIKKSNNVLLEEISAYYYLMAFWKVFSKTKNVYWLPATGNSRLPQLANLMLGWGLRFAVVLDDDSSGRRIYKQLKNDQIAAEEKLIKISGCDGIEDIFTVQDFKKLILKDTKANVDKSSNYMKVQHLSKPVAARDFYLAAENGTITKDSLSKQTQTNIEALLGKIEGTLT